MFLNSNVVLFISITSKFNSSLNSPIIYLLFISLILLFYKSSINVVWVYVTISKYLLLLILNGLSNWTDDGTLKGITTLPSYYLIIGICNKNVCSISFVNFPISPCINLYSSCSPYKSFLNSSMNQSESYTS
jgi:hypothetical protein